MLGTVPLRVALYARVSTSNHGQDVTLQTRELKEFIAYRGGSSPENMWTWESPVQESADQNSTYSIKRTESGRLQTL